MIVVTGAAGFIGSCMIQKLNEAGYADVLAVDDFTRPDKQRNVDNKQLWGQVHRNNFIRWLERHHAEVDAVIHLGARTDTTELSTAIFDELNLEYSRALWMLCSGFQIPFLYASSAATYGLGELGYSDDHTLIPQLRPLNPYGQSKQDFDVWVLETTAPPGPPVKGGRSRGHQEASATPESSSATSPQPSTIQSPPFMGGLGGANATSADKVVSPFESAGETSPPPSTIQSPPFTGGLGGANATSANEVALPFKSSSDTSPRPSTIQSPPFTGGPGGAAPPHWAGFKFFNVYGPNEYHKGRMASVIFHTVRQIKATGAMNLFRSHRPDFTDGGQRRDFIYVKDVVDVLFYFLEKKPANAIYNLGTGQSRTFLDLATNTFQVLGVEPNISFVDTPLDIRDTYQYFTEADMRKLITAGYERPFHTLEAGISDYVQRYLREEIIW